MKRTMLGFTLFALLTLAACGSPAATSTANEGTASPTSEATLPPTAPPTALPTAGPTAQPTAEPLEPSGGVVLLPDEPLPPSDYAEIIQSKVEAGEISVEGGLIAGLKLFAGDASGLEVLGDEQPVTGEGNTLLGLVHEYLATGSDPAAKAEMQRLLNIIAPSAERLLEYAEPEPAGSGGGLRSLAPRLANSPPDDAQCEELGAEGFPPGQNLTCILYTEVTLTNGVGRVFYPATWWPADPNLIYALYAVEALIRSDKHFAQFGSMRSVDMVFTLLADLEDSGSLKTLAMVPRFDAQAAVCQVILYPYSIVNGMEKGREHFQQTMAHELFHCFQTWNISAGTGEITMGNGWWKEGTAEYFSNVVYPTTNTEWRWVTDFDKKSATKPLYRLSYENTVFFQYLGNVMGNGGLIELLKNLPKSDDPMVTADALAAAPGMQETFHQFAQTWADHRIADTGGGFLSGSTYIAQPNRLNVGNTSLPLNTVSLMVQRYLLTFTPMSRYQVTTAFFGAAGLNSARPEEAEGGWADFPAQVVPGCEDYPRYLYILTTTTQGLEWYQGTFHASVTEDPQCRPQEEESPAPQGQTACDHPYLPLRPGAIWDFSASNGPRTWIVDSVTPSAETPTEATAIMRVQSAGQEFTYTWQCSATEGLSIWLSETHDSAGQIQCDLVGAEGALLRTRMVVGTEWVFQTTVACDFSTILGNGGIGTTVTEEILKVIGFDQVALPDGRVVDGLQIDRRGETATQFEVDGVPGAVIPSAHHYTWVLARGVGIVQFGDDATLVSYSIP